MSAKVTEQYCPICDFEYQYCGCELNDLRTELAGAKAGWQQAAKERDTRENELVNTRSALSVLQAENKALAARIKSPPARAVLAGQFSGVHGLHSVDELATDVLRQLAEQRARADEADKAYLEVAGFLRGWQNRAAEAEQQRDALKAELEKIRTSFGVAREAKDKHIAQLIRERNEARRSTESLQADLERAQAELAKVAVVYGTTLEEIAEANKMTLAEYVASSRKAIAQQRDEAQAANAAAREVIRDCRDTFARGGYKVDSLGLDIARALELLGATGAREMRGICRTHNEVTPCFMCGENEIDQLRADLAAQKERADHLFRTAENVSAANEKLHIDLAAARAELATERETCRPWHEHALADLRERAAKVAEGTYDLPVGGRIAAAIRALPLTGGDSGGDS